jgi:hypothetical protein
LTVSWSILKIISSDAVELYWGFTKFHECNSICNPLNTCEGVPMKNELDQVKQSSATPVEREAAIRRRAYEIYEQRGRADGFELEDWAQAETEILGSSEMPKAA